MDNISRLIKLATNNKWIKYTYEDFAKKKNEAKH